MLSAFLFFIAKTGSQVQSYTSKVLGNHRLAGGLGEFLSTTVPHTQPRAMTNNWKDRLPEKFQSISR